MRIYVIVLLALATLATTDAANRVSQSSRFSRAGTVDRVLSPNLGSYAIRRADVYYTFQGYTRGSTLAAVNLTSGEVVYSFNDFTFLYGPQMIVTESGYVLLTGSAQVTPGSNYLVSPNGTLMNSAFLGNFSYWFGSWVAPMNYHTEGDKFFLKAKCNPKTGIQVIDVVARTYEVMLEGQSCGDFHTYGEPGSLTCTNYSFGGVSQEFGFNVRSGVKTWVAPEKHNHYQAYNCRQHTHSFVGLQKGGGNSPDLYYFSNHSSTTARFIRIVDLLVYSRQRGSTQLEGPKFTIPQIYIERNPRGKSVFVPPVTFGALGHSQEYVNIVQCKTDTYNESCAFELRSPDLDLPTRTSNFDGRPVLQEDLLVSWKVDFLVMSYPGGLNLTWVEKGGDPSSPSQVPWGGNRVQFLGDSGLVASVWQKRVMVRNVQTGALVFEAALLNSQVHNWEAGSVVDEDRRIFALTNGTKVEIFNF